MPKNNIRYTVVTNDEYELPLSVEFDSLKDVALYLDIPLPRLYNIRCVGRKKKQEWKIIEREAKTSKKSYCKYRDRRKYSKEHYRKNRERYKEYHENNKEHYKANYETNKEKIREYNKNYYRINKEQYRKRYLQRKEKMNNG